MSRPLIPANAPVRLALKTCFEKDCYYFDLDGLRFLQRNGLDRYATARAVIRHLDEGRQLYCKCDEKGGLLPRHYHGEVALDEGDLVVAYLHLILTVTADRVRVRAHVNFFPRSLPW